MSQIIGRAWKFSDNITTDYIAPGRYFHLRSNLPEFAKHVLEDIKPEFVDNVKAGDMIVAGTNFGMGSSREHAPAIIKLAGVGAVLAKSFSRIFFRNAINIGLPVIQIDTDFINEMDRIAISLEHGIIENLTTGEKDSFNPLPKVMINILDDGGLVNHIVKHKGLILD
ncbi:MAG: 3-isopropylmalate dehydratase small subunit [Dehalobacterium sp.]